MAIETVLGPVNRSEFRWTSMHEHVFCDGRVWYMSGPDQGLARKDVCIENLGFLRWNIGGLEDNLVLDDPYLAVRELSRLRLTEANAIVDLTPIDCGRRVADLPAVSRAAGVHVAVGCSYYVDATHPESIHSWDEERFYSFIKDEMVSGIDDTGIRPALIGELGTSERITERERRMLRGGGLAGKELGVCVNVHLDPRAANGLEVVETLTGVGVPAGDIILSHMQNQLDWGYQHAVLESGAVVEYDTFGEEGFYGGSLGWRTPTDVERIELLEHAVADGFEDTLVVGADVGRRNNLRAYGGMGYDHLFTTIHNYLRERGMSEGCLEKILLTNPLRLLDRSTRNPVEVEFAPLS